MSVRIADVSGRPRRGRGGGGSGTETEAGDAQSSKNTALLVCILYF